MSSRSAAVVSSGLVEREAARAFIRKAFSARGASPHSTLLVTVPAPVASPDALLRAFPQEASVLWDPPHGSACSGLGVAHRLPTDVGSTGDFFDETEHVGYPHGPSPRVFGGSAFAPGTTHPEPWEGFGDGFLLLPKWTYQVDERAWLTLAVRPEEGPELPRLLTELDTLWDHLERPIGVIPGLLSARRVAEVDAQTWAANVEAIREQIRRGTFEKVVAARHCVVELEAGAGSLDVLRRLDERFAGCTRFALWKGDAVFLGATPELLVSRRGSSVCSEALAGSTEHGDAARMLSSDKERAEHQTVVRAVVRALEPFCRNLQYADTPTVRELPNVLHMHTPIHGKLSEPTHILTLVQALQPTPAVGGVPTDRAVSWIVEHEVMGRGWYSAPVGWADANGDGEFVVALRSGLLRNGKAWVYAGAGIMADSDPVSEYAETELKMQALLGALHGDGS